MSSGTLFRLFIVFISTAIFIRIIGAEGYAIIGIIFSFFSVVSRFDITFFLSLVKYNSDYLKKKKRFYKDMFNTIYCSILFSNILLFVVLFLVVIFLSNRVYHNPNLVLFYTIALLIFLFERVIVFLKDFIRANRQEIIIQQAVVVSLTCGFIISTILLLVFKFGVLSIFIGTFFAKVLEYTLLYRFTKKRLVEYRPYLSISILVTIFKKYTFQNYIEHMLGGILFYGGLFISTIYLDASSVGVLTIFILICSILREIFSSLWFHLAPLYSHLANKKNYSNIKTLMKNITFLLLVLFIVVMVFFLTIGKPLFSLYFGISLKGTYFLFLLMISGELFHFLFISSLSYMFVTNIRLLNKILFVLTIIFLLHLFPLVQIYGLPGVVVSYFVVYCLRAIIFLLFFMKMCWKIMDKVEIRTLSISLISLVVTVFIVYKEITFEPILASVSFIILLFLIIIPYIKKISELFRYFIYEI